MVNMSSATNVPRNSPKLLRKPILKENLLMDVPYFIKEHSWMSTFAEATLKFFSVEVNPP